jgi:cardiolipin synthase
VGDAGPAWLPVEAIGELLLWIAAILTLMTGYDYLRAGLNHMHPAAPPAKDAPSVKAAKPSQAT